VQVVGALPWPLRWATALDGEEDVHVCAAPGWQSAGRHVSERGGEVGGGLQFARRVVRARVSLHVPLPVSHPWWFGSAHLPTSPARRTARGREASEASLFMS
jgi:hypothetical protein